MRNVKSSPSKRVEQATRKPNERDRRKLQHKIYADRHGRGHFIADDDDGRSWLLAFLLRGCKTKPLKVSAPWLTDDKLRALRKESWALTFDDIGLLIHLTDKERTDYKAWRFIPWNVAPLERDAWLAAKRLAQRQAVDRRRHQRKLDEQALLSKGDQRLDAIERMLRKHGAQTILQLAKRAVHSRVFAELLVFTGKIVTADSRNVLRNAVHRTVEKGVALGRITPVQSGKKCYKILVASDATTVSGRKRRQRNGLTPISHPLTLSRFAIRNGRVSSLETHTERAHHLDASGSKTNGQCSERHQPYRLPQLDRSHSLTAVGPDLWRERGADANEGRVAEQEKLFDDAELWFVSTLSTDNATAVSELRQ
jgi:hypothetical protein